MLIGELPLVSVFATLFTVENAVTVFHFVSKMAKFCK